MMVREFMTPRVIAISPDASIADAAKLMLENKISGLPVIDATRHVIGIVSEHDLLRPREGDKGKLGSHWLQLMIERARLVEESARFHDRRVNDVMTPSPITVAPNSSLGEVCRIIEERGVKRLPVVENGKLVGIIARADLVRALAQTADSTAPATVRDESVNGRLRELERQILRNRVRGPKPF
jgi:CBS domain-containing protein